MLTKLLSLVYDDTEMPKMHLTHSEEHDEAQLEDFPTLLTPVMMDYGYNVKYVPAHVTCLSSAGQTSESST